jgi:hypothetical protein
MFDDYFDFVEDTSLLTNLPKDEKFIVLRAAEMTPGFANVIFVVDQAKTASGEVLKGLIEVRTKKPAIDHSPFWKTFDALKLRKVMNRLRQRLYKSGGGGYI